MKFLTGLCQDDVITSSSDVISRIKLHIHVHDKIMGKFADVNLDIFPEVIISLEVNSPLPLLYMKQEVGLYDPINNSPQGELPCHDTHVCIMSLYKRLIQTKTSSIMICKSDSMKH